MTQYMARIMKFDDYNQMVSHGICNLESLKSLLVKFSISNKNVFEIQRELGTGQMEFITSLSAHLKEYGKYDNQSKFSIYMLWNILSFPMLSYLYFLLIFVNSCSFNF